MINELEINSPNKFNFIQGKWYEIIDPELTLPIRATFDKEVADEQGNIYYQFNLIRQGKETNFVVSREEIENGNILVTRMKVPPIDRRFKNELFTKDWWEQQLNELEVNNPILKSPLKITSQEQWDRVWPILKRKGYMLNGGDEIDGTEYWKYLREIPWVKIIRSPNKKIIFSHNNDEVSITKPSGTLFESDSHLAQLLQKHKDEIKGVWGNAIRDIDFNDKVNVDELVNQIASQIKDDKNTGEHIFGKEIVDYVTMFTELEINNPSINTKLVHNKFSNLRTKIFSSDLRMLTKLSYDSKINNMLRHYIDRLLDTSLKGIEYEINQITDKNKLQNIYKELNKIDQQLENEINLKVKGNIKLDELEINKPNQPTPGKIYDIKVWWTGDNWHESKYLKSIYEPIGNTIAGEEGWYWSKGWRYQDIPPAWNDDTTGERMAYDGEKFRLSYLNKEQIDELEINAPKNKGLYVKYKDQLDDEINNYIKDLLKGWESNYEIIKYITEYPDIKSIINEYVIEQMKQDEDYEGTTSDADILDYIKYNKDISQYLAKLIWKYYFKAIDIKDIRKHVYNEANEYIKDLQGEKYIPWAIKRTVDQAIENLDRYLDVTEVLDDDQKEIEEYLRNMLLGSGKEELNELEINNPNNVNIFVDDEEESWVALEKVLKLLKGTKYYNQNYISEYVEEINDGGDFEKYTNITKNKLIKDYEMWITYNLQYLVTESNQPTLSQTELIKEFLKLCKQELGLKHLPKIKLTKDKSETETYAHYDPSTNTIVVYIKNRSMGDWLRSLCHELKHAKQRELGELNADSGEDGSSHENEANSFAGKIMREFGRKYPMIYEGKQPLNELEVNKPIHYIKIVKPIVNNSRINDLVLVNKMINLFVNSNLNINKYFGPFKLEYSNEITEWIKEYNKLPMDVDQIYKITFQTWVIEYYPSFRAFDPDIIKYVDRCFANGKINKEELEKYINKINDDFVIENNINELEINNPINYSDIWNDDDTLNMDKLKKYLKYKYRKDKDKLNQIDQYLGVMDKGIYDKLINHPEILFTKDKVLNSINTDFLIHCKYYNNKLNELEINNPINKDKISTYDIKPKAKYYGFNSIEDVENAYREIEEDVYSQMNLPLPPNYDLQMYNEYDRAFYEIEDQFKFKYGAEYNNYREYFKNFKNNNITSIENINEQLFTKDWWEQQLNENVYDEHIIAHRDDIISKIEKGFHLQRTEIGFKNSPVRFTTTKNKPSQNLAKKITKWMWNNGGDVLKKWAFCYDPYYKTINLCSGTNYNHNMLKELEINTPGITPEKIWDYWDELCDKYSVNFHNVFHRYADDLWRNVKFRYDGTGLKKAVFSYLKPKLSYIYKELKEIDRKIQFQINDQ